MLLLLIFDLPCCQSQLDAVNDGDDADDLAFAQGVKCIPASDVSASEAAFQGLTVTSLKDNPQVKQSLPLGALVTVLQSCVSSLAHSLKIRLHNASH